MYTYRGLFILLLSLTVHFVVSAQRNKELNIYYLGFSYYIHPGGHYNFLSFELTNKSNDTLYILKSNILVNVYKKNRKIEEMKKKEDDNGIIACPFFYFGNPIGLKEYFERNKSIDTLRYKYVKKLLISKHGKDSIGQYQYIIDDLSKDILVIMPHESINHDIVFRNEQFDKTCKVYARYEDKDIFSKFTK